MRTKSIMYQSSTITLLQIDKKTETPSINITDEITSDHLVLFSSTTTVLFSSCEVGSFAKLCRPGLLHPSPVVERIYLSEVCPVWWKNETSEKKRTRNQTNIIPILKIWFNFNQQTYQTVLRSLPRPVLVHTCNS